MGRWLLGLWPRWVAAVGHRERGTVLAMFRIAMGLILIYALYRVVSNDVVDLLLLDKTDGGYRSVEKNHVSRLFGGPTKEVIWGLVYTGFISASLLTVGLFGRLSAVVANQAWLGVLYLNNDVRSGADLMLMIGLFVCFLGETTATWSLDCRVRTGRWSSDKLVPSWPRKIIILQISIVYFSTALHKIAAVWSWSGSYSSIWWTIHNPNWNRFDVTGHPWLWPITQVGTFVTWWWEVIWPILIPFYHYRKHPEGPGRLRRFFNRWDIRWPLVLIGLCLHLGIHVLMEVGPFLFVCAAYYLCLWNPDEYDGAWARFQSWRARRAGAPVSTPARTPSS